MKLREAFETLEEAPTYGWSEKMKEALSLAVAALGAVATLTREDAEYDTTNTVAEDGYVAPFEDVDES
jgi:hypothetical protein